MSGSLALVAGMLLSAALACFVVAGVRWTPRLDAALERASGGASSAEQSSRDVGPVVRRSERLGALVYRASPLPLTANQRSALRLRDKPIAEFYADKAVMAVVGALIPAIGGALVAYFTGVLSTIPAFVAVMGAVLGYFTPDLLLRRSAEISQASATETLLVFIDLVTLERLTNASATQALHNAAALSEAPLFVQIRTALERARLEQQSPYAELRRLADQLRLAELIDVADVMQLDDTGAALSGTLRARVKELRDGHLTREQIQASAAAEGMTIYMTLPALIFGLIFLVAALLRILHG